MQCPHVCFFILTLLVRAIIIYYSLMYDTVIMILIYYLFLCYTSSWLFRIWKVARQFYCKALKNSTCCLVEGSSSLQAGQLGGRHRFAGLLD